MSEPIPSPSVAAALDAALAASGAAVGLYDPQDRLCYANARFEALFLRGLPLPADFAEVIRHGFRGGFGVKIDSGDVEAFLGSVLQRRRGVAERSFATDLVDGTWLWINETVLGSGWLLSVLSDVTALKQEERVLRQARDTAMAESHTDPLTGLANRRRILDQLRQALAASAADGRPLSVAIVDLDHFKPINDAHGHLGGDEALRGFAHYLQGAAAPLGPVGRIGGEEFLLLLPGLDQARALAGLEAVRAALPPVTLAGAPLQLSFSAGVAQFDGREAPAELMRRADLALYRAKTTGRNRVVAVDTPQL